MPEDTRKPRRPVLIAAMLASLLCTGCASYGMQHEIQRDSHAQILLSEKSQVQVRNAQSRVYDTKDKLGMLKAVVATFQDLGFQIEVLDETLGIVSGKKFLSMNRPPDRELPTYLLYDEESLVVFQKSYRTWGPFKRRSDLVRLTVTVRSRNVEQLIVRAAAQFFVRPVEQPEAYQAFYAALEQALFQQRTRDVAPGKSPTVAEPPAPTANQSPVPDTQKRRRTQRSG